MAQSRKCESCLRAHTTYCPMEERCYLKEDKPYWISDDKQEVIDYINSLLEEQEKLETRLFNKRR